MKSGRVGIVGAGPGGLAAGVEALIRGFEVDLYEAQDKVGGRNAGITLGDFHFDTGPTFFLMPEVLESLYARAGRRLEDYVPSTRLDPMYELHFADDSQLVVYQDPQKMAAEIGRFSKRDADRFWAFRDDQKKKFEALEPALSSHFSSPTQVLRPSLIGAAPHLNFGSVYSELASYFEDERVRLAFTFQAKYLGMSPFDCPSLFTILPHIEHSRGVWKPRGGCSAMSDGLARLFVELGGRLHLNAKVNKVVFEGRRVKGIDTDLGFSSFDGLVMNADFAYAMKELVPAESRKKYTDAKLDRLKYSCSTFMLYLGINKTLPLSTHGIYFAQNYRKNVRELSETLELSDDPSVYLHNGSAVDPTMAPKDQTALYVLVPVPNQDSRIDWASQKQAFRDKVIDLIESRAGIKIRNSIVQEKVVTPLDWERSYNVYKGATFSLAHNYGQLLNLRPQNRLEEFENLYLVGGGTHPGSGLPTIFESSRISIDLLAGDQMGLRKKLWSRISQIAERSL
jgi:phytoene desaturase